jgi:hypothetical protein
MNTKTEEKKDGKPTAPVTDDKKIIVAKIDNGQSKNQEEKKQVEDIKKLLDLQIHKFEQLSLKIEHRERFIRTKDQLKQFHDCLKSEKDKNNPDQDIFFIKLQSKENYSGRAEISVNNISIIEDFLVFIAAKIETKILQLEKEIIM